MGSEPWALEVLKNPVPEMLVLEKEGWGGIETRCFVWGGGYGVKEIAMLVLLDWTRERG